MGVADTLKGGAKKPEVAKVLCVESGPGVDWLIDKFELDLSLIARLGGHSMPRKHRGKERFPGMTITYALMQAFEKVAVVSEPTSVAILSWRSTAQTSCICQPPMASTAPAMRSRWARLWVRRPLIWSGSRCTLPAW